MTNVAVVCDEKTRKYATYLSQLVMQKDDSEDGVVGTKDGEVNVMILSEEEYRNSRISSSQYVIFIGDGDVAKESRALMKTHYKIYGMKYAWLGHQCALYVEEIVHKKKEYEDFLGYARKYQEDVRSARDTKRVYFAKDAASVGTGIGVEALGAAAAAGYVAGGPAILGILAAPIFAPVGAITGVGLLFSKLIRSQSIKKKILDQQYCCLILNVYLKGMNKFLNQ